MSFATILHVLFVIFAAIAVAPHPAPKSSILVASFLASRLKMFSFSSRMNLVSAWPPGQYMDQNGSWNTFLVKELNLPSMNGSWYKRQFSVSRNNFSSGVRWSRVISVLFKIALVMSQWFWINLLSDALSLLCRILSHVSFVLFENFRANSSFFEHMFLLIIVAIFET